MRSKWLKIKIILTQGVKRKPPNCTPPKQKTEAPISTSEMLFENSRKSFLWLISQRTIMPFSFHFYKWALNLPFHQCTNPEEYTPNPKAPICQALPGNLAASSPPHNLPHFWTLFYKKIVTAISNFVGCSQNSAYRETPSFKPCIKKWDLKSGL